MYGWLHNSAPLLILIKPAQRTVDIPNPIRRPDSRHPVLAQQSGWPTLLQSWQRKVTDMHIRKSIQQAWAHLRLPTRSTTLAATPSLRHPRCVTLVAPHSLPHPRCLTLAAPSCSNLSSSHPSPERVQENQDTRQAPGQDNPRTVSGQP